MVKNQRAGILIFVINIKDNLVIVNRGNIRVINTGEGIVAFGKFFLGSGTGNYFAAKYNGDTVSPVVGSKTQAVQQIGAGVCDGQINWFLSSCDHDRTAVILDQIGQGSCSVSHGISAVADHKSIVEFIFFLNELCQLQPVVSTYIGTVQGKRLHCVDGAELFGSGDILQQFFCGNLRGKSFFGIFGSNCTAGGDQ